MSRKQAKRNRSQNAPDAEMSSKRNKDTSHEHAQQAKSKRALERSLGSSLEVSDAKRLKQYDDVNDYTEDAATDSVPQTQSLPTPEGALTTPPDAVDEIRDFIHSTVYHNFVPTRNTIVLQSPPRFANMGSGKSTPKMTNGHNRNGENGHLFDSPTRTGKQSTPSPTKSPSRTPRVVHAQSPRRTYPKSPRDDYRISPRGATTPRAASHEKTQRTMTDVIALVLLLVFSVIVMFKLWYRNEELRARRGHAPFREVDQMLHWIGQRVWNPVCSWDMMEYERFRPIQFQEIFVADNIMSVFIIPVVSEVTAFVIVSLLASKILERSIFLLLYIALTAIGGIALVCFVFRMHVFGICMGVLGLVYWYLIPSIQARFHLPISLWSTSVSARYRASYPWHFLHMVCLDGLLLWTLWSAREILSVIAMTATQQSWNQHSSELFRGVIAVSALILWVRYTARACANIAIAHSTMSISNGMHHLPAVATAIWQTYRYHLGSASFGGFFLAVSVALRSLRFFTQQLKANVSRLARLIAWWMVPLLPIKITLHVIEAILWGFIHVLAFISIPLFHCIPVRYAFVGVHGVSLLSDKYGAILDPDVMTTTLLCGVLAGTVAGLSAMVGQVIMVSLMYNQVIREAHVFMVWYTAAVCEAIIHMNMYALLVLKISPPVAK